MGKKPNYYNKIVTLLQELNKAYPNQTLGSHIASALEGYNPWIVSDRELLFSLEKYQLEKDNHIASDADVQKIYNEGLHLDTMFLDEDEDY